MGRKITAREVAKAAGVSASTVDRVLNERGGVTPDKEQAVLRAARRLGLDRALTQRAARTLRIAVLTQPANPFHIEVARGFEAANRSFAHYNMQFRLHHIDPAKPAQTAARIAESQADGLVIVAAHQPEIAQALARFEALGKPVVTLATEIGGGAGRYYVGPDNLRAGRMAGALMGRFLHQDAPQVLVIAGQMSMTGHAERVRGFCEALLARRPQAVILPVEETQERPERAGEIVARALRAGRLAGVYNATAGARSVAAALGESGAIFITHELSEPRRALLRAGAIDAILDQDPAQEVRVAVELLAAHFGRMETWPASLLTPVHIHLAENC